MKFYTNPYKISEISELAGIQREIGNEIVAGIKEVRSELERLIEMQTEQKDLMPGQVEVKFEYVNQEDLLRKWEETYHQEREERTMQKSKRKNRKSTKNCSITTATVSLN